MNFKQTASVIGSANEKSWTQIFEYKDLKTKTIFICVLSLKSKDKINLALLGKSFLEKTSQDFFSSKETAVTKALKTSFETNLGEVLKETQAEIVTGVFRDEYAYFCVWGENRVYLLRDGKLLPITVGKLGVLGSCSGKIETKDIFILGTKEFYSIIEAEELARILAPKDLSFVSETLTTQAHKHPILGIVASFLEIGDLQENQAEEIIIQITDENPLLKPNISFFKEMIKKLPTSVKISKDRDSTPRKTAVLIGTILIFVLLASIFLGITQRQKQNSGKILDEKLSQAQNFYSDSLTQKEVNPSEARRLFEKAQEIISVLEKDYKDNEKLKELKQKIEGEAGVLLGKITEEPEVFFDLSIIRSDAKGKEIFLQGSKLIVLDGESQRLLSISSPGKETSVLGGNEKLPSARSLSFLSSRYFVLTDDGVKKISRDGSVETEIENDSDWGNIAKIAIFSSNLYILNSEGEIWRYTDSGSAFGNKTKWSKEASGGAIDFVIDGYVWVLGKNNSLKRFSKGEFTNFQIKNLEQPLKNSLALHTDELLESIYLLDKGRIVEINKQTGEFKKEYVSEKIAEAIDLVISKPLGKIYLLTETKILELPLR